MTPLELVNIGPFLLQNHRKRCLILLYYLAKANVGKHESGVYSVSPMSSLLKTDLGFADLAVKTKSLFLIALGESEMVMLRST